MFIGELQLTVAQGEQQSSANWKAGNLFWFPIYQHALGQNL